MKKYKAAVEQLSVDQNTIMEQSIQISELEAATSNLRETIAELTAKLETLEGDQMSQQIQKRFQMKVREVETRLELETTTKSRLEVSTNCNNFQLVHLFSINNNRIQYSLYFT